MAFLSKVARVAINFSLVKEIFGRVIRCKGELEQMPAAQTYPVSSEAHASDCRKLINSGNFYLKP